MTLGAALGELAAAATAPVPDAAAAEALLAFEELVRSWRARTDLVAGEGAALREVLFLDAFALASPALLPEASRVIDVGAGAGAPAIPLALLRPDLVLTLLEPRRRRVAFLRTAVGTLGLVGRVRVLEGRLDDPPGPELRGAFDVGFSRATFAPDEWVRRGAALARRTLVLGAAELPAGAVSETRYAVPSTGAPRAIGVYGA
ncbi:MAG: RsmG family class I SAM-dependent methyltransferase [Myxococcota bacterium]